jgi:hypothetical protein
MLVSGRHRREDVLDELVRDELMKKIGHRIDEYAARLLPPRRLTEALGPKL